MSPKIQINDLPRMFPKNKALSVKMNTWFSDEKNRSLPPYSKDFKLIKSLCKLAVLCIFLITLCSKHESAYAEPKSRFVGSVEGELLMNGSWLRQQEQSPRRIQGLSPIWSARPALDFALNHYLWIGGEFGVTWLSEANYLDWQGDTLLNSYHGGRRMLWSPNIRARIDFPLDCRWTIEGLVSTGISRWGLNEGSHILAEDEARWGVNWRMNLGLRYALNTQVHLLFSGGYSEQIAFGKSDEISIKTYPLTMGLRGGF